MNEKGFGLSLVGLFEVANNVFGGGALGVIEAFLKMLVFFYSTAPNFLF